MTKRDELLAEQTRLKEQLKAIRNELLQIDIDRRLSGEGPESDNPERDQEILRRVDARKEYMKDIAASLNITTSRVSQIYNRLDRLRDQEDTWLRGVPIRVMQAIFHLRSYHEDITPEWLSRFEEKEFNTGRLYNIGSVTVEYMKALLARHGLKFYVEPENEQWLDNLIMSAIGVGRHTLKDIRRHMREGIPVWQIMERINDLKARGVINSNSHGYAMVNPPKHVYDTDSRRYR
jgi:chorismate mutase